MKSILIISFLIFSYSSAFSQWGKKDEINLILKIKDFENKPIHSAIVTIETIDKRQNSRYGKYKMDESINNYGSNKDSLFKITLPTSRYEDRKVSVRVFDTRNMAPYFKAFYKEYESLTDGQIIDIQMEVDKEAFENRTTKVYFSGKIFSFIKPPFEEYFHDIFKSNFSGEIYSEDLEKKIMDTAIVSFSIDKNCNIVNRSIQKKIVGLRTELENVIMDALELRLKEFNEKDYECKEADITGLRIIWGEE